MNRKGKILQKATQTDTKKKVTSIKDELIDNLCNAIVEQAVIDYRKGGLIMKDSCERFFRSERFTLFTSIDGNWLADKLKQEDKARRRAEYERLMEVSKCSGF